MFSGLPKIVASLMHGGDMIKSLYVHAAGHIYMHEIVTIVGLSNTIHIYIYLNLVTNCYKKSLCSDKHVHIILL